MLGSVGLFQVQFFDEFAGGEFAFAEDFDDGDTGGCARP